MGSKNDVCREVTRDPDQDLNFGNRCRRVAHRQHQALLRSYRIGSLANSHSAPREPFPSCPYSSDEFISIDYNLQRAFSRLALLLDAAAGAPSVFAAAWLQTTTPPSTKQNKLSVCGFRAKSIGVNGNVESVQSYSIEMPKEGKQDLMRV